jgi:mRNA-degrading endonuclease RelE of RelBE toxin-antitoxin system
MSRNPPHKWHFQLTSVAWATYRTMLPGHRRNFRETLHQLVNADNPLGLPFVQMLQGEKFQRLRKFRIGDYRVIFRVKK